MGGHVADPILRASSQRSIIRAARFFVICMSFEPHPATGVRYGLRGGAGFVLPPDASRGAERLPFASSLSRPQNAPACSQKMVDERPVPRAFAARLMNGLCITDISQGRRAVMSK